MSKKILILVVSSNDKPYKQMALTSAETWDSFEVENIEVAYYFGEASKNDLSVSLHTIQPQIWWYNIPETYNNMGHKMIAAFETALHTKDFDYIVRINSSCYCDKKQLEKYIETLPETNVFAGVEVEGSEKNEKFMWGGTGWVFSKDIIQLIVDNKQHYDHSIMEDVAIGHLMNKLNVPYTKGSACSLNEKDGAYLCIGYGGESIEFENFEDLKKLNYHFYRCKIDRDRKQDAFLMNKLFANLNFKEQ